MCLRAKSGAVVIEQQLSGQELLIPQTGEISLSEGQIVSLSPSSRPSVHASWTSPSSILQSRRASTKRSERLDRRTSPRQRNRNPRSHWSQRVKKLCRARRKRPPLCRSKRNRRKRRPQRTSRFTNLLMSPLSFDPNAPALSPDPSPDQIVLLRSVHVQGETVYQDVVLPRKKHASGAESVDAKADPAAPPRGFFGKIGRFFHRVFNSSST